MAMFTNIINTIFGTSRDDLEPQPSPGVESGDEPVSGMDRTNTPHEPIIRSIKLAWQGVLKKDVPGHLQVAPDDALYLERIEITARDEESEGLLAKFMEEFSSQKRIDYVKRELGKDLQRIMVLDHFTGIWDQAVQSMASAPVHDAFESILQGGDSRDAAEKFEVKLIGHWGEKSVPQPFTTQAGRKGIAMSMTLWDGQTPDGRKVKVDAYPLRLCRKDAQSPDDSSSLLIDGQYVSSLHSIFDSDGAAITVSDGSSRNGLWLNGVRLLSDDKPRLKAGDMLHFASAVDKDVSKYPRLRIDSFQGSSMAGNTPVSTPVTGATPVTLDAGTPTPIQKQKILALIAIKDAAGSRQVDVIQLPFTIGRSRDQDCVIPEDNAGVSRKHLVINDINEQGALVTHFGFNSYGACRMEDNKDKLPASFLWLFGETIVLAPDYSKSPPVRLTLRQVT